MVPDSACQSLGDHDLGPPKTWDHPRPGTTQDLGPLMPGEKPMKTVELGYMSSEGTHFLFTPNLFDLPAENAVGQNGKALVLLAFSKDWDICVAQAEEQAMIKLGGQWSFAKENLHCKDDDGHDLAKLISGTPKMALSAVPA